MNCRRFVRFAAALASALLPTFAAAQVIVDPNQVRGTVGYTNADPFVLAHLAEVVPNAHWTVQGTSVGLATPLVQSTEVTTLTRASTAYELTVESSAPGIAYDVSVSRRTTNWTDFYEFASATSAVVRPEPAADVELDLAECASLIQVNWTLPDGTPVSVATARIEAFRERLPGSGDYSFLQAWATAPAGATSGRLLVRGDSGHYVLVVTVTTGTDRFSDRVDHVARAHGQAACEQAIFLEYPVPQVGGEAGGSIAERGPGTGWCPGTPSGSRGAGVGSDPWTGPYALGRIGGTFGILGEHEQRVGHQGSTQRSLVEATDGPFGNERLDVLESDPSSGAFALENLPPSVLEGGTLGLYTLRGRAALRSGDGYATFTTMGCAIDVPSGGSVDAGDTLVVAPAYFAGDVLFAQPRDQPGRTGTLLDDLAFLRGDPTLDPDGDGIPTHGAISLSHVRTMGSQPVRPQGCVAAGTMGSAEAVFGGAVRPSDSSFVGSYEVVVGGLDGLASAWNQPSLALRFLDDTTPDQPLTFHDSVIGIGPSSGTPVHLDPGDRATHPLHYCFGELRLTFHSTAGTVFDPHVRTAGSARMLGTDFEGRSVDYNVGVTAAKGTPRGPTSNAASDGLVVALLPEADYMLQPRVTSVAPGGGTSAVQLQPIAVRVGCGQLVLGHTDFILSLLPHARCWNALTFRLEGTVVDFEPITRLSASVDGQPSVDACAPCGVNPTFSVDVPVVPGLNTIVVTAEEASGRTASVTTHVQVALEPSAIDLRPAAVPLRVRKGGADDLVLTWEASPGGVDHVYQGTIPFLRFGRRYDHGAAGACSATAGTATIDVPAGDVYFLIGGPCGDGDTSLGRDSFGRERPPASPACR